MVDIGKNGIFISDEAVDHLNLTIDKEIFDEMKKHIQEGDEEMYKCFVTNVWVPKDKGMFIPADKIADAIEKNIEKQEDLVSMFKVDGKYIDDSGVVKDVSDLSKSEHKKYLKKISLSFVKKGAMRSYVRYLRGKTNIHG